MADVIKRTIELEPELAFQKLDEKPDWAYSRTDNVIYPSWLNF